MLAAKGYFFRMQWIALRRIDKRKRYMKPYQSTYLPIKGISQQRFFLMLCVAYFNVLSDKVSTTSLRRLEKSPSQDCLLCDIQPALSSLLLWFNWFFLKKKLP